MEHKKTVLQINAVYGRGSTGEIMKDISATALEQGWNSYIACSEKKSNDTKETGVIFIGNKLDHKVHALCTRICGLHGYFSNIATLLFLKKVNLIKPDIIHIHNIHSNFLNVNCLFRYINKKRIPTVISLHDCWFFTGKCYHYMYDECEKWKYGCGHCPRLKKEIPSYLFDFTKRVLRDRKKYIGDNPYVHIVGVSEWVTREAKESILKDRVYGTIYNGVDTNIFSVKMTSLREKLKISDKFVILGMANKWLSIENIDTLRYIVGNIDNKSVLVLIGCKDSTNLPDGVIGIKFVSDRNQLAMYYSMADVFVNVTKVDTLPTVNIEALACGTPVITYDSGGSSEILDEGTGYVVPYGDYEGLLHSIEIVKRNGKKYYTRNCVERVGAVFDNRKCYKEYINLYNTLVNAEL